jgi:hypothetical protein
MSPGSIPWDDEVVLDEEAMLEETPLLDDDPACEDEPVLDESEFAVFDVATELLPTTLIELAIDPTPDDDVEPPPAVVLAVRLVPSDADVGDPQAARRAASMPPAVLFQFACDQGKFPR